MEFEIDFYKTDDGHSPVEEFLDNLGTVNRLLYNRTLETIEKLKNRSYHREPLSKYLEPGLWELRVRSENNTLRIVYTFTRGRIIILIHAFIKKQQRTPSGELEIARRRLKELAIGTQQ